MTLRRIILFLLISIVSWSINPVPSIANRTPAQKNEKSHSTKKRKIKKQKKRANKSPKKAKKKALYGNDGWHIAFMILCLISGILLSVGYFSGIPILVYIALGMFFLLSTYPLLSSLPNPSGITIAIVVLTLLFIGLFLWGFLSGILWLAIIMFYYLLSLAVIGIIAAIIFLIFA